MAGPCPKRRLRSMNAGPLNGEWRAVGCDPGPGECPEPKSIPSAVRGEPMSGLDIPTMYDPVCEEVAAIKEGGLVQELFRLRSLVLGFVLAAGIAFAAAADEAKPDEGVQSDQDMSVGEATDHLVEDAEKVGDKAEEVGSDIAEGVEDAFDSDKESNQEATE